MEKRKILDEGYISLVEHWGSDQSIIEAARMSTDKGFEGWGGEPCPVCEAAGRLDPVDHLFIGYEHGVEAAIKAKCPCKGTAKRIGDEGLLGYLYRNKHATPFEMAGLIIEVQAPLFVFREWHRHRTQSFNELSARYVKMPNLNYMPTMDRLFPSVSKNKQAGTVEGALKLTTGAAQDWLNMLSDYYDQGEFLYERGCAQGISKELARLCVPVARYSRMRASANLRNWLAFLTLRMDPKAQWEIREYANAVGTMIADKFPRTWGLFMEGKLV